MKPAPNVECVLDAKTELGEVPVWCPIEQALYWIDSEKPGLHRFDSASGEDRSWPLPEHIGSFALREQGGVVAAMNSGFHFIGLETGAVEKITDPESHISQNGLNDGKCDRRGRFWTGTAHIDYANPPAEPGAALYRLDADLTCHKMDDGFYEANTLAWSMDDKIMYFSDSNAGEMYAYDFDIETGAIANRRLFARTAVADIPLPEGTPAADGSTIDAEGFLWSCFWDGWKVVRYAPDGTVNRIVMLPVQRPTSAMFGGDDLSTLYITSARTGLDANDLAKQPLAGGLFALDPGVKGVPEPRFAG
jgi:sugar lactone lactonase YvrE